MDSPISRALKTAVGGAGIIMYEGIIMHCMDVPTNRYDVLEVVSPAQDEGRGPTDTRPDLTYQPCQEEFDNQMYHCNGEGEWVALQVHRQKGHTRLVVA